MLINDNKQLLTNMQLRDVFRTPERQFYVAQFALYQPGHSRTW